MTYALSAAISTTVAPRRSVWSSATPVTTATAGSVTLVASQRPPSPTSSTAISTPRSANSHSAAPVSSSNSVSSSPSRRAVVTAMPIARAKGSSVATPGTSTRSAYERRCGLVYDAGAPAVGRQERPRQPRDRGLAVRAGDLHHREGVLRPAERLGERADALEGGPDAEPQRGGERLPGVGHGERRGLARERIGPSRPPPSAARARRPTYPASSESWLVSLPTSSASSAAFARSFSMISADALARKPSFASFFASFT